MRKRNIDKFNSELPFTEPEFEKWLEDNYGEKAKTMFKTYVDSDCDKYLKPSIDRIDDYKGYSFDIAYLLLLSSLSSNFLQISTFSFSSSFIIKIKINLLNIK